MGTAKSKGKPRDEENKLSSFFEFLKSYLMTDAKRTTPFECRGYLTLRTNTGKRSGEESEAAVRLLDVPDVGNSNAGQLRLDAGDPQPVAEK